MLKILCKRHSNNEIFILATIIQLRTSPHGNKKKIIFFNTSINNTLSNETPTNSHFPRKDQHPPNPRNTPEPNRQSTPDQSSDQTEQLNHRHGSKSRDYT